jgi:hypothetical protein
MISTKETGKIYRESILYCIIKLKSYRRLPIHLWRVSWFRVTPNRFRYWYLPIITTARSLHIEINVKNCIELKQLPVHNLFKLLLI